MEGLNENFILDESQIDMLFNSDLTPEDFSPGKGEEEKEETETTEVNPEDLFGNKPESVGSEEDIQDNEETTSTKEVGSSPNNIYSSITNVLVEDGFFTNLEDKEIKNAEDFVQLVEEQIQAKFDERQKRIDDALNAEVEISIIKQYENTLNYLDSISDSHINDESERGETLRKQLILQDLLNKGYSKERADRELKKSFDSGSDIEDAKDALLSNKEFYKKGYDKVIKDAQDEIQAEEDNRRNTYNKLKDSIMNDKTFLGDLSLDKLTRQKMFDNLNKPIYTDSNGNKLTAIQKYESENKVEFLKNLSLVFTLTDGFKNLDGLIKGSVRKASKKAVQELEQTLNNTRRNSDGHLSFVSNDNESYISKGFKLDI